MENPFESPNYRIVIIPPDPLTSRRGSVEFFWHSDSAFAVFMNTQEARKE